MTTALLGRDSKTGLRDCESFENGAWMSIPPTPPQERIAALVRF